MSKGSQTSTQQTTNTTTPPPYVQSAYQQLIGNAGSLQNMPAYSGEGVAPFNPQQYTGVGNINQYAFAAQPYYGLAGGMLESAATPIDPGQIMSYYNPYQQNVIKTTQEQF